MIQDIKDVEIKTKLIGNRLHITGLFSGNLVVEDVDNKSSHEYLVNLAFMLRQASSQVLREADKYEGQEWEF
jgi:hypothetical protein